MDDTWFETKYIDNHQVRVAKAYAPPSEAEFQKTREKLFGAHANKEDTSTAIEPFENIFLFFTKY